MIRLADIRRPTVPHEHGAWAIFLLPIAFAAGTTAPTKWPAVALFTMSAIALFFAQAAFVDAYRGRKRPNNQFWTAVFAVIAAASGGSVVFGYRAYGLLLLLLAAASGFGAFVWLRQSKRKDRSLGGELFTTALLTLTGPGAYLCSHPFSLPQIATLWIIAFVFFAAQITYVRAWLEAAKLKRHALTGTERLSMLSPALIAHAALLGLILFANDDALLLLFIAIVPMWLRLFWGAYRLHRRPAFKALGMVELAVSLWALALSYVVL